MPSEHEGDNVTALRPEHESQSGIPLSPAADGGEPLKYLSHVLTYTFRLNGSDIHLRNRHYPTIRIDGKLAPLDEYSKLTATDLEKLAQKIMTPRHWDRLQNHRQVDLSLGLPGVGRVRANIFFQRGTMAMAFRLIQASVPSPEQLALPSLLNKVAHYERGLVIVTGATGSGKSTTIASLLDVINHHYHKHIITIEDPIEYLILEDNCIVSQRELGVDVNSFLDAMTGALREDPDVILLGEMRDPESIETALTAAETGHLVFTTLHAPATAQTISRMVSSFGPTAQPTIRSKLAQNLRAVIAQRLLPRAKGKGRIVAIEFMTVTPLVRELILNPLKANEIADLVRKGNTVEGMLSFDRYLFDLVKRGEITRETALQHASSITDLRLKLDGFQ